MSNSKEQRKNPNRSLFTSFLYQIYIIIFIHKYFNKVNILNMIIKANSVFFVFSFKLFLVFIYKFISIFIIHISSIIYLYKTQRLTTHPLDSKVTRHSTLFSSRNCFHSNFKFMDLGLKFVALWAEFAA